MNSSAMNTTVGEIEIENPDPMPTMSPEPDSQKMSEIWRDRVCKIYKDLPIKNFSSKKSKLNSHLSPGYISQLDSINSKQRFHHDTEESFKKGRILLNNPSIFECE